MRRSFMLPIAAMLALAVTLVPVASSAEVSELFGIPGFAEMGFERNGSYLR